MGAFIAKQPNGLYCRFSTVEACPTNWNMTEEDYIELRVKEAREEAKYTLENRLQPFDMVKEHFWPVNMTAAEFKNFLKETSEEVEE